MSTIGEQVARDVYGKSDLANAQENQTVDFQAGYRFAVDHPEMGSFEMIDMRYIEIGRPATVLPTFREWKRGMWAAVIQRITSTPTP